MKILMLSNRLPFPPKDGGAIAVYNMMKGLKEAGNTLTLFSLNTPKHYIRPDQYSEEFQSLGNLIPIDIDTSLKAINAFLNLFTKESYNLKRFYAKHVEDALIKLLKKESFDLIQVEGLFMAPYIELIRKYSKAICVLRTHNIEHQIWERLANQAYGLKKWYLKLLTRRLKRVELTLPGRFDAIIPITEEDAAFFRKQFPATGCFVCPAGVDLDKFIPDSLAAEPDTLFHLGALNWMPNAEAVKWFIHSVWPQLHAKYPSLRFVIAGKHTPAEFFGWKYPNVEVAGEVEDAVAFMNSKKIMIVPLLSGSGMRLKIIEGMACAKTIVSTPVGAEGIAYTQGKDILIAEDADAFAQAISYCLEHPYEAEQIGEQASKLAREKYNNRYIIDNLLSYYRQLV